MSLSIEKKIIELILTRLGYGLRNRNVQALEQRRALKPTDVTEICYL